MTQIPNQDAPMPEQPNDPFDDLRVRMTPTSGAADAAQEGDQLLSALLQELSQAKTGPALEAALAEVAVVLNDRPGPALRKTLEGITARWPDGSHERALLDGYLMRHKEAETLISAEDHLRALEAESTLKRKPLRPWMFAAAAALVLGVGVFMGRALEPESARVAYRQLKDAPIVRAGEGRPVYAGESAKTARYLRWGFWPSYDKEVLAEAERAVLAQSSSAASRLTLARIYAMQGRRAEAREVLRGLQEFENIDSSQVESLLRALDRELDSLE